MAMWLLGVAFALVGVPFAWIAQRTFACDRAEARWPRAPGVVNSSRVKSWQQVYRDADGYDAGYRTYYRPMIDYTYTVGGQVLEGTRIARVIDNGGQYYLDTYPPQKEIMVFYDPADPTKAFLEVRRSRGAVLLLAFGSLWFAIGGLLIALDLLV